MGQKTGLGRECVFMKCDNKAMHKRPLTVKETTGAVPPLIPSKGWKEMEAIIRAEVAECHRSESNHQ